MPFQALPQQAMGTKKPANKPVFFRLDSKQLLTDTDNTMQIEQHQGPTSRSKQRC